MQTLQDGVLRLLASLHIRLHSGKQIIEEGDVFYLCDSCLHEFVSFLDIDLYMVKERIQ